MPTDADDRRSSPAALRNRDPILAVLREILPASGMVLELASGSGEHVIHFARHLPGLTWLPSDPSSEARASIAAWREAEGLSNVAAPLALDAAAPEWPVGSVDAILCINMVHISPWAATEGLIRQAGQVLTPHAPLYLYGPYRRAGHPLEPSNAAFDADLRRRDPAWGLRALEEVEALASQHGLTLEQVREMPANNLSVVFRRG
ncbi:MAG: DUF938 domain-containing protein [Sphingomonadales bacterium]|nr:DUF938 domain-containing protein [Sphingomonadales bacterium]